MTERCRTFLTAPAYERYVRGESVQMLGGKRVSRTPLPNPSPDSEVMDAACWWSLHADHHTPESLLRAKEHLRVVEHMLEKIVPREARVLRMRFGLDGEDPLTLKQTGNRIGLSVERTRQVQAHAIFRIRALRYRYQSKIFDGLDVIYRRY